ncbi:MAG: hypothetical protein K9M02_19190 [Thiohalocapsa sp.]|nr:hypothetical protein [Thiohalocapsa sp.]
MGGQQLPINVSGLIVAAMLVVAALLDQQPLQSQRPQRADINPEPSGPYEQIPARTWEDPFEAVKDAGSSRSDSAPGDAPDAEAGLPQTGVDAAGGIAAPGLDADVPSIEADQLLESAGRSVDAGSPPAEGEPGMEGAVRSGDTASPAPDGAAARAAAPEPATSNVLREYLRYLADDAGNDSGREGPAARLMLMPVMVSGAPHGAAREMRLRRRAAVHAALFQRGFRPTRADRIGVWRWEPLPDVFVDVPFEAFKMDANGRRYVVVLWLNDEAVTRDYGRESYGRSDGSRRKGPLVLIDSLLERLGYPSLGDTGRLPYPGYRSSVVRVIGPGSSDSLQAVYAEIQGSGGPCTPGAYARIDNGPACGAVKPGGEAASVWSDASANFALISPFATAPASDLVSTEMNDGPLSIRAGRGAASARSCGHIRVYRTVVTDDATIAALADELAVRGIDPSRPDGGFAARISDSLAGRGPSSGASAESGVGARVPRDHVVLISEWDTKFGRTLPELFLKEISRRRCTPPAADTGFKPAPRVGTKGDTGAVVRAGRAGEVPSAACAGDAAPSVHMFYYMRGLDGDGLSSGRSAGSEGAVIRNGKLDLVSLAAGQTEFREPASGTNQFDYLRRLTLQVADLDWTLRRRNQGAVRAFGILGNDYFDKLLILQALKERFPSHLYFTTDLDAGFLDTRVFRRTRNLVIAAPFGLSPADMPGAGSREEGAGSGDADRAQRLFPPFRHSLQTALYLSVLAVLDGGEAALARGAADARPLLFEVGQDRFFALKPPPAADGDTPEVDVVADDGAGLFTAQQTGPWRTGVSDLLEFRLRTVLLVTAAALTLMLVMAPRLRRRLFGFSVRRVGIGAWLIALLVVAYLSIGLWMLSLIHDKTEPFTLFSGISVWPSEIVRLSAGLIAWLLLLYGWRRVRDGDRSIRRRFEVDCSATAVAGEGYAHWYPAPAQDQPADTMASLACRLFRRTPDHFTPPPRDRLDGVAEWCRYRRHARLSARLMRVLPAVLVFWLLAFLVLYGVAQPATPHRGEAAYWFSVYNGWLFAGLPFAVLLFGAIDEAFLCSGLLTRLEQRRVAWPLNTYAVGCQVDQRFRKAIDYWITTELIAERTAPAAQVIHLPFIVILFLLLSISTRFDNWNTPGSVFVLIVLAVGMALLASLRLRATAQRIRRKVLEDLKEEVTGIRYAEAQTQSEKLRTLVERIEKIHDGAYTQWYNEPVFRALAWVLAISIFIITEYATVGG